MAPRSFSTTVRLVKVCFFAESRFEGFVDRSWLRAGQAGHTAALLEVDGLVELPRTFPPFGRRVWRRTTWNGKQPLAGFVIDRDMTHPIRRRSKSLRRSSLGLGGLIEATRTAWPYDAMPIGLVRSRGAVAQSERGAHCSSGRQSPWTVLPGKKCLRTLDSPRCGIEHPMTNTTRLIVIGAGTVAAYIAAIRAGSSV